MEETLANLLGGLVVKYPWAMTILVVIGVLRSINKPLFSLMRALAKSTTNTTDDGVLDQIEQSKAYKILTYILDWTTSVKLPPQKSELTVILPPEHK